MDIIPDTRDLERKVRSIIEDCIIENERNYEAELTSVYSKETLAKLEELRQGVEKCGNMIVVLNAFLSGRIEQEEIEWFWKMKVNEPQ